MTSKEFERDQFMNYFKRFKRFDIKQFDLILGQVQAYAERYGLNEDDLTLITSIGFNQQLAIYRCRKLLRCLIPAAYVPEETIRNVLEYLIRNYRLRKVSPINMKLILQWLAGLIEYKLVTTKVINDYYHLYYYFLPYENISKSACKLIYLLTKPSDVKRWYVKQVLNFHNRYNKPMYTGTLLYLFKMYRPVDVPEKVKVFSYQRVFQRMLPDSMVAGFQTAQEHIVAANTISKNGVNWFQLDLRNQIVKRKSVKLITAVNEMDLDNYLKGSNSLMSISSVQDLHNYELSSSKPNRVMFLLNNVVGYHILTFTDRTAQNRFCYQLYHILCEAFIQRNPQVSYEEKENLLMKLSGFQIYLFQSIPVVSKFLAEFLLTWDGIEHERYIYSLLQFFDLESFEKLDDCILVHLYDLFISSRPEVKANILELLAKLAYNIIMIQYYRIKLKFPILFLDIKIEWDFEDLISKLYKYINKMCLLGLYLENNHNLVLCSVLFLNEKILSAERIVGLNIWNIHPLIAYSAFFATNAISLIMICRLYNKNPKRMKNRVVLDLLNCLALDTAFKPSDTSSVFNSLNQRQKNYSNQIPGKNCAFGLKNHFGLACYNYKIIELNDLQMLLDCAFENYNEIIQFISKQIQ